MLMNVEISRLKKVHEAPLFDVTLFRGEHGLVIYRIKSGDQAIDFSPRGMSQLATFMEDYQREAATARHEKREEYAQPDDYDRRQGGRKD
jgi:hypothetical protein